MVRRWLFIAAIAAASSAYSQAPQGDRPALTRDEVEMRAATNFGMFDSDEDGVLTAGELNAPRQTMVNQNETTKRILRDVFSNMDTDKNGWMSVAEYQNQLRIPAPPTADEFLARADSNNDKKLTLQELRPVTKASAGRENSIENIFKEIDTDKDSYWTLSELNALILVMQRVYERKKRLALDEFTQLDTDRNGRVSRDEYAKAIPGSAPLKVDSAMADYDSNKDRKISRAEFQTRALAEFDRMDLNKDGVIRGAEQTLKCTTGFGSSTFLDPVETVRPICAAARN